MKYQFNQFNQSNVAWTSLPLRNPGILMARTLTFAGLSPMATLVWLSLELRVMSVLRERPRVRMFVVVGLQSFTGIIGGLLRSIFKTN